MSEQKQSFMRELDLWTEANVVNPLVWGDGEPHREAPVDVVAHVKHAIREKVLESYKNGVRAGAGAVRKEMHQHAAR